jgi:uncharacterized SAM-binding protein YcdF (DUF218 family)
MTGRLPQDRERPAAPAPGDRVTPSPPHEAEQPVTGGAGPAPPSPTAEHLRHARILAAHHRMPEDEAPCDVAIGLGTFGLDVPTRCARLYHAGRFPLLVLSGAGNAQTARVFPRGEAVHYREHVLSLGVPGEAVLVEPRATNTGENIAFSRDLLHARGVRPRSVLLVATLTRRPYATARRLWPEPAIRTAGEERTLDDHIAGGTDPRLLVEALVGESRRLLEYPALGHTIPQPMPPQVREAYEALRRAGYGGPAQRPG